MILYFDKIQSILEEQLFCSPDRISESCQWSLFGWDTYHGCGYKQKLNKREIIKLSLSMNLLFRFLIRFMYY